MSVSVWETFTLIDERSHFHSSHFESFLNRPTGKAKRVPPTRCIPASKKIASVSNSAPSICITFVHRSHLHERKFAVESNESHRTTGESRHRKQQFYRYWKFFMNILFERLIFKGMFYSKWVDILKIKDLHLEIPTGFSFFPNVKRI